ncbi:IclR family transcriptional regulator [Conexibacter sp. CPCC 206217]|uniref:IclR family transcriptional regulator n=1 Tax=Conexibacter sp. CPCC 206217 TaxID=3064574 RepID=UPI0027234DD3|nr:IclR family transcriptional regulator [Conexibacter sp. CPCC 206217]MDO8212666.1 IclR family transcriptional regulator [Conexibacter sp. CPCC 206217]
MSERHEIDQRYYVETAARALQLLRAVAALDRPASLGEIVEVLGWSKPAVYRLVRTLETEGALRQQDGRGYVMGPAMITLGQAALRATRLPEIARPHMERLAAELSETIVLTVLDGDEVVYVDRIEADQLLIPRTRLGSRLPAYCTSTGQMLLSGLDDDEVRRRVAGREFVQRAPHTLKSIEELLERLDETRRRGYAINDEELAVGHRAAAAPVFDHSDRVVAAISVSVPSARVALSKLERFAVEGLMPAADAISFALGGRSAVLLAG